jgi:type 1 fimbriae regulatory protein FimE
MEQRAMSTVSYLRRPQKASPAAENGKVSPPRRRKNADLRPREYLTPKEIHQLERAAGRLGRHGPRDAALVSLMFRHGLRVSEVIALRWEQVQLSERPTLDVRRLKGGVDIPHPLHGPEIRALRQLRRQYPESAYVFASERGASMTASNVRKMVARAGQEAKLPFPVHPHMLRHSIGYKFANAGHDARVIQDYLGHKSIQHTVRYTKVNPDRFLKLFRD